MKEVTTMDMPLYCIDYIVVATNIATAESLVRGLERGDLDWRELVK